MADYNINAVPRKVSYTGSAGLGPYAFSFEVLTEDDVAVYFNETLLTKTTDYTVTVNANGTGSVTIVTGSNVPSTPTASDLIIIVGARDIERTTDFVTAGDLRAASLNEQLDALTIMVQQVAEEVERSVKAPVFDPTGINMVLPKQSDRVNAFVAFDENGDISAAVPSDDVTTLAEVATDIKLLADIEDGTVATDTIQTVAAIDSDVATVAGISSDVTIVAADQADIGTVATNLNGSDTIGTVAGSIANVNATGNSIADVNTVAGELGAGQDVTVVAADLSGTDTIGTVAGSIADVNTVAGEIGAGQDVTVVAANIADVGTVATDIANVNTTATNIANVNTTASISADVTTVAGISGDVSTVAGISTNVTAVANNNANVTTVANDIANVNTVGGISTDVTAVAAVDTDVTTVAGVTGDVSTVAGISADVSSVAAIDTDVSTVAANITDVNSFADTYFVSATEPTSPTIGDLWFDTTNQIMKVYTDSGFANAGSSVNGTSERQNYVVGTPSGSYDGSTTVFPATYDAGFVDVYLNGVKLVVGTDFTATNGTSITLTSAASTGDVVNIIGYGTFELANFSINDANDVSTGGVTDGQVLAYNNSTGDWEPTNIAADAITEGNSSVEVVDSGTGRIQFTTDGSEVMRIDSSGNVGIGTNSPSSRIDLLADSGDTKIILRNVGNSVDASTFIAAADATVGQADLIVSARQNILFRSNLSDSMRLDNNANLQFNSGYGSVATAYGCRAWVNFDGTGTVAIRESGNVSSVTDNGKGQYTINFSTAMPDVDYCVVTGMSANEDNKNGNEFYVSTQSAGPAYNSSFKTTSSVRMLSMDGAGANRDCADLNVSIFR